MTQLRRRNALLEGLEAFRRLDPAVNLTQVVAFNYIAENEGLSISELAYLLGATRATGSRTARSLLPREGPEALSPYLGLVTISSTKGELSKSIALTELGRELRGRIDALIAEGTRIEEDEPQMRAPHGGISFPVADGRLAAPAP
jgi:DNA-binding MarR family transcriptional regulator